MLDKIISLIKGEKYEVDKSMPRSYAMLMVSRRGMMLLRGFFAKPFLKRCGRHFFLGRKARILAKNKISIGRSCTIEDGCYVDALSRLGIKIGNNFKLGKNSTIECTGVASEIGEGLVIGDNVGISERALIAVRGKITIGNDVIIGPNVSLQAENHNYTNQSIPIRKQGTSRKGIIIEDNCWLGCNVIILDGVTISSGSVVAAGAVVTKDVPSGVVVAGVPAKVIKRCDVDEK